jgi:DNA-binding transcriptional MerR regulator
MYNTKVVVQQTGIPAPTLRAWERRYTLLSPERANNAYRLYSERDIALIRWLKERVGGGLSISQAVALFKTYVKEDQSHAITPNPQWFYREHTTHPVIQDAEQMQNRLIDAFRQFDENAANMLMGTLLTTYSVEQVCLEIITPTMWCIGQCWAEGNLTVSVEHFASSFFRAMLSHLFHITTSPRDGPLTLVCCAPEEPHELASLMLALFLRRSGVHVAYLGQKIETGDLIKTIRQLKPVLLCVSLTVPTYLATFIELAHHIQQSSPLPPTLAFGGQGFYECEQTIPQIPGVYLSGDLCEVMQPLRNLAMQHS